MFSANIIHELILCFLSDIQSCAFDITDLSEKTEEKPGNCIGMRIVILRHGEAALSNFDRVLSSNGMKEAAATGQKLSKILKITRCFCSSKTRAEQTANIVCQQLGFEGANENFSELSPSGNPAKVISYIDEKCDDEDTVLLVSHLPLVELLAYEYNGKLNFPPKFSTACALIIDYDFVRGKYKRFISPFGDDVIFD